MADRLRPGRPDDEHKTIAETLGTLNDTLRGIGQTLLQRVAIHRVELRLASIERKLDALILQGPALEALRTSIGGLDRDVDGLEKAVDSHQAPPTKG